MYFQFIYYESNKLFMNNLFNNDIIWNAKVF